MASQTVGRLPKTKYRGLRLTVHCLHLIEELKKVEGLRDTMIIEMAVRDRAAAKGIKLEADKK